MIKIICRVISVLFGASLFYYMQTLIIRMFGLENKWPNLITNVLGYEIIWPGLVLGFLGGIPAGMGMGGGTVTIPLLVLVGGVEQKIAQSANLFSFLPMSLSALKTHSDNGLLATSGIFWSVIPALLLSAAGAFLAASLPSEFLQKAFGAFLIGLSFVTLLNKNG